MWRFPQKVGWRRERPWPFSHGVAFVLTSFFSKHTMVYCIELKSTALKSTAGCFSATTCANQKYLSVRGSRDRWHWCLTALSLFISIFVDFRTLTFLAGLWNTGLSFSCLSAGLQGELCGTRALRHPSIGWIYGWSLPQFYFRWIT